MCLLFETIQVLNGKTLMLEYHQQRVNRSRRELLGCRDVLSLSEIIRNLCLPESGCWKLRIPYEFEAGKPECAEYTPKVIRHAACCETGPFHYSYKFSNRSHFEDLMCGHPGFDELILTREGEVTDSCYTNLAFYDGRGWFTPQYPLLCGTRRQQLLDRGMLIEKRIMKSDIKSFEKVSFFNTMLGLDELSIDTKDIAL